MNIVERFKGLANGIQVSKPTDLISFLDPRHNIGVLNFKPDMDAENYAGSLDLAEIARGFRMIEQSAGYGAALKFDAGVNTVTDSFKSKLPDTAGRTAFFADIAMKKDVSAALMGCDEMGVSLLIKFPNEPAVLHQDPQPGARFLSMWRRTANTGFVGDNTSPLYKSIIDPEVATKIVYPDQHSLYGFKSRDYAEGHLAATHVEPYVQTLSDTRFGLYMHPATAWSGKTPDPQEVAERLTRVQRRWAHRFNL